MSISLMCLNAAIDQCAANRKSVADDLAVTEQALSKMTAGTQAFGVDRLDQLADDVLIGYLERLGAHRGFEVRLKDPVEIDGEILEAIELLVARMRLRDVRGRAVKAQLRPAVEAERRRA